MMDEKSDQAQAKILVIICMCIFIVLLAWVLYSGGYITSLKIPNLLEVGFGREGTSEPKINILSFNPTSSQVYNGDRANGMIRVSNDGTASAENCRVFWNAGELDSQVNVMDYSQSQTFGLKPKEELNIVLYSPEFKQSGSYKTSICVICDNNVKSTCRDALIKVNYRLNPDDTETPLRTRTTNPNPNPTIRPLS
jgi:hypothetical protein